MTLYAVRLSEVDMMTGEWSAIGFTPEDKHNIRKYRDDRRDKGIDAKVKVCKLNKRRCYPRRDAQSKQKQISK